MSSLSTSTSSPEELEILATSCFAENCFLLALSQSMAVPFVRDHCPVSPPLQCPLFVKFSVPLYFSSSSSVALSNAHITFVTFLRTKVWGCKDQGDGPLRWRWCLSVRSSAALSAILLTESTGSSRRVPLFAGAVPHGDPWVPSKTNACFRSAPDRVQSAVAAVQQPHPCEDVHGRADACRLGSVCAQGSELVRAGGECPCAWEQSLWRGAVCAD